MIEEGGFGGRLYARDGCDVALQRWEEMGTRCGVERENVVRKKMSELGIGGW